MMRTLPWLLVLLIGTVGAQSIRVDSDVVSIEGHIELSGSTAALQIRAPEPSADWPWFGTAERVEGVYEIGDDGRRAAGATAGRQVREEPVVAEQALLTGSRLQEGMDLVILPRATTTVELQASQGLLRPAIGPLTIQRWATLEEDSTVLDGTRFINIDTDAKTLHVRGDLRLVVWSQDIAVTQEGMATWYPTGPVREDAVTAPGGFAVTDQYSERQLFLDLQGADLTFPIPDGFDVTLYAEMVRASVRGPDVQLAPEVFEVSRSETGLRTRNAAPPQAATGGPVGASLWLVGLAVIGSASAGAPWWSNVLARRIDTAMSAQAYGPALRRSRLLRRSRRHGDDATLAGAVALLAQGAPLKAQRWMSRRRSWNADNLVTRDYVQARIHAALGDAEGARTWIAGALAKDLSIYGAAASDPSLADAVKALTSDLESAARGEGYS